MATHSKDYDFSSIETRWQSYWAENQAFAAETSSPKPKYYLLDMFPYPSGAGLHLGHCENYAITDVTARYQRANGKNVLYPVGWDAFGLPTEQKRKCRKLDKSDYQLRPFPQLIFVLQLFAKNHCKYNPVRFFPDKYVQTPLSQEL